MPETRPGPSRSAGNDRVSPWLKIRARRRNPPRRRRPDDDDQHADVPGRQRPGERPGPPGQQEQPEQPEDAVDHHRRHGLRAVDLHPHEVGGLEEVAPHRAWDHQVEDVADVSQQERRAGPEPRLDHPDQEIPAQERQVQAQEVDRQPRGEQPPVERAAQHLVQLHPVLVKRQPEQAERQGHPRRVRQGFQRRAACGDRAHPGRGAQRTPLVEGTPAALGSCSEADRRARASPLKIASLR